MAKQLRYKQLQPIIRWSITTYHGRFVGLGFLAGMLYFFAYLNFVMQDIGKGGTQIILNLGCLYLGLSRFWQRRDDLVHQPVLGDDRLIGHALIVGGAVWMPFSQDSLSLQSSLWILILIGIAWSSFTPAIFGRFPLATGLVIVSMYPDWDWLSSRIFQLITGPYWLENKMAWVGSIVLSTIGFSATAQARFLLLADGAVEIAPGCSGYDMAFVLAGISLIWGLMINQSKWRIALTMAMGVAIALLLNVPRIMLLAFASIYWGPESFNFWHGTWGGQIFSAIMFTIYYYAAIAIYKTNTTPTLSTR